MTAKSAPAGTKTVAPKQPPFFRANPRPFGSAILTQIRATHLTAPPMASSTPPKTLPDRRTRAPIPRPVIDVCSSNSDDNDAHPYSKTPLVIDISSDGEGYEDACCEECGSGELGAEMLLCDKCDKGYHLFCLRPILVSVPKGLWVCPPCSSRKKLKSFPLVQTKIIDFFRIRTMSELTQKLVLDAQKKRRRPCRSLTSKKKRRLIPFNPIDNPVRQMEQMASLATALTATGAQFSNELTYSPSMARRSANRAAFEKGGMQVLCKEDVGTLNLCKSMMEKGIWPPLMVVFDPQEGFTVEADRFIRDLTIVTEYAGDVDYLENREDYDGDSMMTLLSASNPSRSLVICPDKRANIARFINGINNHTPEGKKKQNLKCVRFDVDGKCRVLLIANRDITKGERLYYDYNGSEHEYPTEHFL